MQYFVCAHLHGARGSWRLSGILQPGSEQPEGEEGRLKSVQTSNLFMGLRLVFGPLLCDGQDCKTVGRVVPG